jgi:hypothetical protein
LVCIWFFGPIVFLGYLVCKGIDVYMKLHPILKIVIQLVCVRVFFSQVVLMTIGYFALRFLRVQFTYKSFYACSYKLARVGFYTLETLAVLIKVFVCSVIRV